MGKSVPLPFEGRFDRSVSLLCWAYNEELIIEGFLRRADALMRNSVEEYEIVVIDDCSTDRTNDIVRHLQQTEIPRIRLFRNEANRNVGYSCRKAIQEAKKEFLFWQTVDWSYDISRLREFLELLKKIDVVAGVRRAPVPQKTVSGKLVSALILLFGKHLTKRSDTIGKAVVSVINYSLIRILFGMPMSDYQNVVFYRTSFIQSVKIRTDSSFVNPELLLNAYWSGRSIAEVPISFIPRTAGEAKGTRLKAIRKSVKDVFCFWVKYHLLADKSGRKYGEIARLDPDAWEASRLSGKNKQGAMVYGG
jgi:glycosyltransferase involved in cell wall biosynthesis